MPNAQERPKVLIVDDVPDNLDAIEHALAGLPIETMRAESGEEAVSLSAERELALVLLDIGLPRLDGFGTASQLWREPGAAPLPVVLLTGELLTPELRHRAWSVGATELLPKPIDAEALRAKVALFAEIHRHRREALDLLREAIRSREEFIAIAAHELRAPVAPLALQCRALRRAIDRGDPKATEPEWLLPKLQRIDRCVGRLERLMDRLLDVSRLAVQSIRLEPRAMDLADAGRTVAARIVEERPELSLVVHAEEPVVGRWDPIRVEEIVTNLLSNAAKYGGERPIELTIEADGEMARIAVRDHGIGITSEAQERIFQRFERFVSSRSAAGFGLGLWIVRQIVEAHGGQISVWSQPGEGSRFTVELPREPGWIDDFQPMAVLPGIASVV
ncbi:MAG: hybrid sensor histidine kinase/response regulator [Deltaproteobacteria bacterium]